MGEKRRAKSKGKTAKSTKGLRPHELREKQDGFKGGTPQPAQPTDRKEPRS